MRVRALSPSGDMTFGHNASNFLINTPSAVAQLIGTRLKLWTNEWFLNLDEGTPWLTKVLGAHTVNLYDTVISQRILDTPGVIELVSYQSRLDTAKRILTIAATVNTQYGRTNFVIDLAAG